jgi:hypothetical protein
VVGVVVVNKDLKGFLGIEDGDASLLVGELKLVDTACEVESDETELGNPTLVESEKVAIARLDEAEANIDELVDKVEVDVMPPSKPASAEKAASCCEAVDTVVSVNSTDTLVVMILGADIEPLNSPGRDKCVAVS